LQQSARAQAQATSLACPDCGMTLAEFRSKGRLGCPRDYEIFREHLDPLIERIHNAKHHLGRGPGGEVRDGSQAPDAPQSSAPGAGGLAGLGDELIGGGLTGGTEPLADGLAGELAEAWASTQATGEEPEDPRSQLETLERALAEAVHAEQYERAAELRDAIQTLRDSLA
jgi:protein-arginine kinase activator protein McsA